MSVRTLPSFIETRLWAFTKAWPNSLNREYERYTLALNPPRAKRRSRDSGSRDEPFWVPFPGWLFAAFTRSGTAHSPRGFLNDVIWAQYCLFLAVRVQDDLVDSQARDSSLIYAADEFLLEAERVLARHFGLSPSFSKLYRGCVLTTTRALVGVHALHRSSRIAPARILAGYADESALFDVAPAAICIMFNRAKDFPRVAKFSSEMVVAGQIMDDLQDIEEDLRVGRWNYVVRRILGRRRLCDTPSNVALELIGERVLQADALDPVFDEIRRHLESARDAIEALTVTPANALVCHQLQGVEVLRQALHRRRVDLLFRSATRH